LFIPKNKQLEPTKEKLSDAATKARQDAAEASMKATAEKLRVRAAAGEDFDKLQTEAFAAAGLKAKAPNTDMGKVRRTALPPAHAAAFDLKTGQVSSLITDGSGFFVYKMGERDTVPLDKAKEEIHNTLRGQRMQDSMESMQHAANPTLNDDYFGPEQEHPGMGPGAGMRVPGKRPMPAGTAPPPPPPAEPK
jgi:parvulin-like peptidyl-prolyl isomerase